MAAVFLIFRMIFKAAAKQTCSDKKTARYLENLETSLSQPNNSNNKLCNIFFGFWFWGQQNSIMWKSDGSYKFLKNQQPNLAYQKENEKEKEINLKLQKTQSCCRLEWISPLSFSAACPLIYTCLCNKRGSGVLKLRLTSSKVQIVAYTVANFTFTLFELINK